MATVEAGRTGGPALSPAQRTLRLLTLAWPTIVARAGILTMNVADLVMVGRYSASDLAALSLGVSLFIPIMVSSIGVLIGASVLIAQNVGARRHGAARAVFERAVPWSAALGAGGMALALLGPWWFALIGQEAGLAEQAGRVAQILAPAIFFQLVFIAGAFYFEAAQNPAPVMRVMLAANLLNIGLNYLLIGGPFGLPALGAEGAALSTTAVRVFFAAAIFVALWRSDFLGARGALRRIARRGVGRRIWGPGGWRAGAPMRRIGLASGAAVLVETSSYAALTQAAGLLGERPLAAWAIVYNVEAVTFMIAVGVATATAALVGAAVGAGDRAEARRAAITGGALAAALMGVCAALAAAFGADIAAAYTAEPSIRAAAAALFALAWAWILFDGVQITLAYAARATGEAWPVTARQTIAFLGVLTPAALGLAFVAGWGAPGLVIGAFLGVFAASALMAHRVWTAI